MSQMETLARFGIAGCAGIGATSCVHPLDVVRVNLQVDQSMKGGKPPVYRGMFHVAQTVFQRSGVPGLYSGLSAGYFRQITYGMPRMALYPILADKIKGADEETLPLWKKFVCGATAGGTASISGVPSEVSLVRMAADQKLAIDDPLRRNYSSVFDAISRIAKEEGVSKLWEGAAPTIARAILLNAGQLAVYSDAKERLRSTLGLTGIPLQFSSSLVASVVATAMCCPADVVKSRMQNMQGGEYSGVADCVKKMVKHEGPLSLWKGYTPAMIKLAPHTVVSFMILDNLSRHFLGKDAL